ncbi:MAG: cobalamin-dependent protein [bacterium]|nr:MAG: cobalamin-dependent protein [bacterium]
MNVLLVSPPSGFSYTSIGIRRPPLGLAYLAAVLKDHHNVQVIDFTAEKRDWRRYPYCNFDIVGISVDTARYNAALKIADRAKDMGATVVMGGPHVSFMDEETLESGSVDYIVRNEGEFAFRSLVDYLSKDIPLEEVRGVSYRTNGKIHRTPLAPFIRDLDSIPFPARNLLPLERYNEKMNGRLTTTLVTSRGCPFNCTFCSSSQFFGVRWRARSAENVIDEIELLYHTYGYRALSFVEDNFTLDPDRAVKISEMIQRKRLDIIWGAWSRVDTIVRNPLMVKAMARAGFRWTFIGFESGSQEVLDEYGKHALTEDSIKAKELLDRYGVGITGSFIIGSLDETKDMMKETIDFAKRLNPCRVQFSILTPYPGTELFERVKNRLLTRNWGKYNGGEPTIKLDHVSPRDMRRLIVSAYYSFYGRPVKFVRNLPYLVRALPSVWKLLLSKLLFFRAYNSASW